MSVEILSRNTWTQVQFGQTQYWVAMKPQWVLLLKAGFKLGFEAVFFRRGDANFQLYTKLLGRADLGDRCGRP